MIVNMTDGILKIATSTKEAWEATTTVIPEGVLCFETDTYQAKVGNGIDLYTELLYTFDHLPSSIRDLLAGDKIVIANSDNLIDTSYFPSDVFNIHVVVADITARDALSVDTIKNSVLVLVVDASSDTTVTSGMATYVAKFSDEVTYVWVKTGEGESLDLDLSQFLLKDTVTLDDIADSDTYTRFM